ncbi:hypothetical protein [Dyadobacter sp. CY323]|uniref:phage head spike fiber domain-containing protein n=1 Tax=Dyadobacter sp. CY323 TaxID=2907302 RepID=UPI001F234E5D|nr:hypothetical protein [Dyadobacter sp. CY323]MCE6993067.1 hypothetical protein [Dyadobacter sp. CY323]
MAEFTQNGLFGGIGLFCNQPLFVQNGLFEQQGGFFSGASLAYDFLRTDPLVTGPGIPMTRLSGAMRYNAQGIREFSNENLLVQSNNTASASWTKSGTNVTANIIPGIDGYLMDLETQTGSTNAAIVQSVTIIPGTVVTASADFKYSNQDWTRLLVFDQDSTGVQFRVWVNLSTGASGTVGGSGGGTLLSHSVVNMGNGIYRVSITGYLTTAVTAVFQARATQGDASSLSSAAGQYYIGRCTFKRGGISSTYIDTTTTALYTPRLDYNPTTLQPEGYLMEKQTTNLFLQSNNLNDAAWTKTNSTVTTNAAIGADGVMSLDLVQQSTTSALVRQSCTVTASTAYVFSADFKKSTAGDWLRITLFENTVGGNQANVWFNLTTGVMGQVTALGTATAVVAGVKLLPNDIYRVWITFNLGTDTIISMQTRIVSSDGGSGASAAANYYQGCAQLELGTRPTSYIATGASQVTRAADTMIDNAISWYNQSEGTLYFEVKTFDDPTTVPIGGYYHGSGSNNERLEMRINNTTPASVYFIVDDSVTQGSPQVSGQLVENTVYKFSTSYKVNDFNVARNGSVTPDTAGTVPSATQFRFGSPSFTTNNIWIRKFGYWPYQRPNTDLVSITT